MSDFGRTRKRDEPTKTIDCTVKFVKRIYPKRVSGEDGVWQVCLVDIVSVNEGVPYCKRGVSIVGNMVWLTDEYDSEYRIVGDLTENTKYGGLQYIVTYSQEIYEFDTYEKQVTFLDYILTDKQLNNLIKEYPQNPIKPLEEHDMNGLMKVSGIGVATATKLLQRFDACKDKGKAYIELSSYGLTKNMIDKIVMSYGSPDVAVSKIKDNPYILIEDVDGIGFKKADEIALNGGYDSKGWKRCRAFVVDFFKDEANKGNSFTTYDNILDAIDEALGSDFPDEAIHIAMRSLEKSNTIWSKEVGETTLVALKRYYDLELSITEHLERLINAPSNLKVDREVAILKIKEQEARQGWEFTRQQLEGIFTAMDNNVTIIRGYGGTGKSSCVTGLLACAPEGYSFKQCALSGKASVNLTDITGEEGYTIHRLLGVNPETGGFLHNELIKLDTDLVILDEGSMVDVPLFEALIQAIPTGAKLIILGDTNQLESIGVGNLLLDMIDSGVIPVMTFDEVHRQGAKSAIIGESIKIAKGIQPVKFRWEGTSVLGELQDLKYIGFNCSKDEQKPTIDLIFDEYKRMYKECKDISKISVVVPTKERGSGCLPINKMIQDYVLPREELRGHGFKVDSNESSYVIYKGDKVINLKNARPKADGSGVVDKCIYNGNMGEVVDVGYDYLVIDFYNIGEVTVRGSQLEQIALGYAITVHKSQGSTIPYTIFALDYTHYSMLTRQLVYTGLTRAKKKCTMIFETGALFQAIKTNKIVEKDTFLYYFLTKELEIE